jgi:hypothetical protein
MEPERGVALSTSRAVAVCLFVGLGMQVMATKADKEGGQSFETGLIQSGIAFCFAGEEVSLGVLFCGRRACLGGGFLLVCLALRAEEVEVMSLLPGAYQSSYQ